MPNDSELLNLRLSQQTQILDQYRLNLYNMELKIGLIVKMMEEKGVFALGEFDKRWPLFLKNDVGTLNPDGSMEGDLKISFYNLK